MDYYFSVFSYAQSGTFIQESSSMFVRPLIRFIGGILMAGWPHLPVSSHKFSELSLRSCNINNGEACGVVLLPWSLARCLGQVQQRRATNRMLMSHVFSVMFPTVLKSGRCRGHSCACRLKEQRLSCLLQGLEATACGRNLACFLVL